jgi:hypothetical protein
MSLQEKLDAAKEKAAQREFSVTITETLKMTVTVEAKDRHEAEQIVSDNWRNSEYILDADHFIGVEFEAAPVTPERAQSGRGKEEPTI